MKRQDYAKPMQMQSDYVTFLNRMISFCTLNDHPHLKSVCSDLVGKEYLQMPQFQKNSRKSN